MGSGHNICYNTRLTFRPSLGIFLKWPPRVAGAEVPLSFKLVRPTYKAYLRRSRYINFGICSPDRRRFLAIPIVHFKSSYPPTSLSFNNPRFFTLSCRPFRASSFQHATLPVCHRHFERALSFRPRCSCTHRRTRYVSTYLFLPSLPSPPIFPRLLGLTNNLFTADTAVSLNLVPREDAKRDTPKWMCILPEEEDKRDTVGVSCI